MQAEKLYYVLIRDTFDQDTNDRIRIVDSERIVVNILQKPSSQLRRAPKKLGARDEVKARVKQRKPPFKDREEQRMRCAKEWMEFKKTPGRVTTTLTSEQYATTSAKSKPIKPGWKSRRVYSEEEKERDENPTKTSQKRRKDSTSSEEKVKLKGKSMN